MRILLTVVIAALLLSACGEDDLTFPGSSEATNTPSSTSTPSPTSTPDAG